jgi:hypothetical protein
MDYTRYDWIMLLGDPLDYRGLEYIDQAVAPFAKLVTWHNNRRARGYVLVKFLYNGANTVPRSLVLRQGGKKWNRLEQDCASLCSQFGTP